MRIIAALFALSLTAATALAEIVTKEISYADGETRLKGFLAYDGALSGKRPGVLVIHEWWGHNDYARERARQLAQLGYVAFALDMYGEGKLATTADEAQKLASPFYSDRETMRTRAGAGLKILQEHSSVDANALGAIGYCFGGTVALELARSGAPLAAVVSFHGGLDTPNQRDARNVKGKVLVCTGGDDPMVDEKERNRFVQEMENAGVDYQLIVYGGARHAFTNKDADKAGLDGVAYQPAADKRSWEHLKLFFAEAFERRAAPLRRN